MLVMLGDKDSRFTPVLANCKTFTFWNFPYVFEIEPQLKVVFEALKEVIPRLGLTKKGNIRLEIRNCDIYMTG